MTTPRRKRSPLERPPSRQAGESLTEQVWERHFALWLALAGGSGVAVAMAATAWFVHLTGQPGVHWYLTFGALFMACWTAWAVRGNWEHVRNLVLGAAGERTVGDLLAHIQRERGYHVLHDVPIYKGGRVGGPPATPDEQPVTNIDHILIGPAGVFVIETKTLSKPVGRKAVVRFDGSTLLVDGHPLDRDPIAQARRNAADVRRAIASLLQPALGEATIPPAPAPAAAATAAANDIPVRPVVLFPGWWVEPPKGQDFWVLNPGQLSRWIETEERRGSSTIDPPLASTILQVLARQHTGLRRNNQQPTADHHHSTA